MNLNLVIAALRQRCPSFQNRVAGAAQFQLLPEKTNLAVPAAYVVPLDDNPEAQRSGTGYRQGITDAFAVIVALDNTGDERGQGAAAGVDAIRRELWKGLLGWQVTDEYDGIEYEGGNLLALDRARLWYQFEFSAAFEIGSSDVTDPETWQAIDLASLPALEVIHINLDAIDPADPNLANPGPDGRIEAQARITLDQP